MSFNPSKIPAGLGRIPDMQKITQDYKNAIAMYDQSPSSTPETQFIEASSRLEFARHFIRQEDRQRACSQLFKAHKLFCQLHQQNPEIYGEQDIRICADLFKSIMDSKL